MASASGLRRVSKRWAAAALLGGALLVGAGFHLYRLGSSPPGLYNDETATGMFALRTLAGRYWPIYVAEDYQGRDALFHYIVAVSIAFLGRTPGALRLPGEIASLGTMAAIYLAVSTALDRRRALLASLIYGFTLWPLLMARFATYRPPLPLVMALMLWLAILAWRTNRRLYWAGAGALLAVAFYTNAAIRVFPLALVAGVAYLALRREAARLWPTALYAAASFAVLTLPLAVYALLHPDLLFRRVEATVVFTAGMALPEALSLLWTQSYAVLRMFIFAGDWNPLNNVWLPGSTDAPRPVFDAWLAAPFVLGHLVALGRWRSRFTALMYIWAGVALLPSILTSEAPHYGRALMILPVLFIWPAEGLAAMTDWLAARTGRFASLLLPSALLMLSLLGTFRQIILNDWYSQRWVAAEYDDGRYAEMAIEINRFLDQGWTGDNIRALPRSAVADRRVLVDRELWRVPGERNVMEFLVGSDNPNVALIDPAAPAEAAVLDTLVILPAGHTRRPLDYFAPEMSVVVAAGGWSWNIAGDQPLAPLYWAYRAARPDHEVSQPPLACWRSGAICLQAWAWHMDRQGTVLELSWRGRPAPGLDPRVRVSIPTGSQPEPAAPIALGPEGLPFSQWRPDIIVVVPVRLPAGPPADTPPAIEIAVFMFGAAAGPQPTDEGQPTLQLEVRDHHPAASP